MSILHNLNIFLRVSFRGCEKFSPGVFLPPRWVRARVAPIKTEKFLKSLSGFSTTFRLRPAPDSSSLSSMSFWSNKTEDGNKQFPTCSVRYVLSVESMIRWRWIALVGIFQSSPWLMLVFRHVEPGASSLPVVVVAHAFWLLVLLPCRSSTRSRRDCRCCWSCARWCWC